MADMASRAGLVLALLREGAGPEELRLRGEVRGAGPKGGGVV